jgi:Kef-type K+ transport system membrane component KefB
MDALYYLGIILVLGACVEWLSPKLHLPKVVGYLLLGLLIGPEVFAFIPQEFVDSSCIITNLALSIIALLVGATLKLSVIKRHLKEVISITLFQSLGTFLIVAFGLYLLGSHTGLDPTHLLCIALLLAAIATATDTAAPLSLVQELKAKGSFTSTFMAIITLDDAVSLLMFILALSFTSTLLGHSDFEISMLLHPVFGIIMSIGLGILAGLLNTFFEKLFSHHKGMETISTLGVIFVLFSLSASLGLEPLLSAMTMGIVVSNISSDFDLIEEEIDNHLIEIIFMLFFILSAMHLKLDTLFMLPIAIEIYVILRIFGKVLGSYLGAIVAQSSDLVKKYMGLALIPQAGVAIGLALSLQNYEEFDAIAPTILNIVIATTFIHEIFGPIFTHYALSKSGECQS